MKKQSKLSIWRLEAGLSQKDLAEKLNVSPSIVAKWETGSCRPKDNVRMLYAQILRKPMEKINEAIDEVYSSEEAAERRQKERARTREYFQNNPQKVQECGRRYREKNREEIAVKRRERYLRDREKALNYQREYYREHRQQKLERDRERYQRKKAEENA